MSADKQTVVATKRILSGPVYTSFSSPFCIASASRCVFTGWNQHRDVCYCCSVHSMGNLLGRPCCILPGTTFGTQMFQQLHVLTMTNEYINEVDRMEEKAKQSLTVHAAVNVGGGSQATKPGR